MAKNKIIYGDEVLIDLTADTVEADKLLKGITAHDKSGEVITGTCKFDADTSGATVTAAEVLLGKTAYARGTKIVGTMPNKGQWTAPLTDRDTNVTVPMGFHDGSGYVGLSAADKEKLIAKNIREGVSILGIEGTMSGSEDEHAQENKNVTPKVTQQIITPDADYTCLRQITVAAIPYIEVPNAAGGITVTIAGV